MTQITIDRFVLGEITYTQVADFVSEKMTTQGRPATNGKSCRYRMDDIDSNCRCAIGHMIPDDKYTPSMEGDTVDTVAEEYSEQLFGMKYDELSEESKERIRFLSDIQSCHDTPALNDSKQFLADFNKHLAQTRALYQI